MHIKPIGQCQHDLSLVYKRGESSFKRIFSQEEKNKNDEKVESDTLLPRWKDGKEEIPSDKYLVDSEM